MSKTYIDISNELKAQEVEKRNLINLRKASHTTKEIESLTDAIRALNVEMFELQDTRFKAYNNERNFSPANQEIFKELISEVGSTPLSKPDTWHWGKWELSFIADYIEENYVRK